MGRKISSSNEMRDWRQLVDLRLLKQSEQTISEIVVNHPKTKAVWGMLCNDSFCHPSGTWLIT
jgi:hypothetical protein